MNNNKRQHSHEGSITVFLSLTLLLILSLIMTVIEGARRSTALVIAERALTTSMDSVLAGFYGPLMDEYHLLGLDSSYDNTSSDYSVITHNMSDYISYSLEPYQGLNSQGRGINLYTSSLESIELLESTSILDHKGEVFIHEATEYMKYRSVGDVVEFFLDKASLLEQPKKVSALYEEKVKLEENLVTIDEGVLALMKYIDGVSTGRKGLVRKKGGSIKTEQGFTKKILFGQATMDSVGINNDKIFNALKDEYTDPSYAFDQINEDFIRINLALSSIEALENNRAIYQEEIKEKEAKLDLLKDKLANSSKDDLAYKETLEASIEEAKGIISQLKNEIETINEDIKSNIEGKTTSIKSIKEAGNHTVELVSGSLRASELAVLELEQIIIRAKDTDPLIDSYEKNLNREKEGLDEDICQSLEEGLEELKRYQLNNYDGYDFHRMKEILDLDNLLLSSCIDNLNKAFEAMIDEKYSEAKDSYSRAYQELKGYETKGLSIDYSTLVIEDEDSPDYLGGMKNLIKEGIIGLVIDPKAISDSEISAELLPSVIDKLLEDEEGFSFSAMLKSMGIGGKDSGTDDLFASFGEYGLGSLVGNGVDEILERLLVQAYVKEHFYRFPVNDQEREGRKPSVLEYEREYLLYGNTSDKKNLEAFIGRIILIRTLLNFTTILGDKDKWKEAKTIASALVGFTGLPILVAITQGILMILLALASALVDTCALLIGKELPIIKKNLGLEYRDILLLTRENIRKKAESYKDDKGFSYNDYITLFLCITNQRKLSYRMMDLIQENIKIRYGKDYNLQNCIFGYKVEARFHIKPVFTSFSFVQKYIGRDYGKPLIIQAECSY